MQYFKQYTQSDVSRLLPEILSFVSSLNRDFFFQTVLLSVTHFPTDYDSTYQHQKYVGENQEIASHYLKLRFKKIRSPQEILIWTKEVQR